MLHYCFLSKSELVVSRKTFLKCALCSLQFALGRKPDHYFFLNPIAAVGVFRKASYSAVFPYYF